MTRDGTSRLPGGGVAGVGTSDGTSRLPGGGVAGVGTSRLPGGEGGTGTGTSPRLSGVGVRGAVGT
ncbi:hypothetical protein [Sphaerisporangium perillae]|uniref:hypothetical protein n=1 Tax=Sphaerisporangium perillae TaxID=2935860 RepID=UPI00200F6156|nr:hypothetical protein [Sphaerisporangium perillae]